MKGDGGPPPPPPPPAPGQLENLRFHGGNAVIFLSFFHAFIFHMINIIMMMINY
jgi:hypothetical protein